MNYRTLDQLPLLSHQPVLLRADLNVPFKDSSIMDDFKLKAVQQTIDALLDRQAYIILLTHIGQPQNQEPSLSTQRLLPWFSQRGYQVTFAPTIQAAKESAKDPKPNHILLLENLRFFPGEKEGDPQFAKQLAALAPWLVNDAFGTLHREDSSITQLPAQFAPGHRFFGNTVTHELHLLDQLKKPKRPFVFILGGAKLATKIPLITYLLDQIDSLILCPALAFTFMKALGKPVGNSLVDDTLIPVCKALLQEADQKNVRVILPVDFQVEDNGRLSYTDTIPSTARGISIGPKTIELITKEIAEARTVFFNGAIGFPEQPETMHGLRKIFQLMGNASAQTFVAGGDSVGFLNASKINGIDHKLSGGGAALAYLSNQPLPGLIAMQNKS